MQILVTSKHPSNAIAAAIAAMDGGVRRAFRNSRNSTARAMLREPWRIVRLLYPRLPDFLYGADIDSHMDICTVQIFHERQRGRTGHWTYDPGRLHDLLAAAVVLRLLRRKRHEER